MMKPQIYITKKIPVEVEKYLHCTAIIESGNCRNVYPKNNSFGK
jgi:hypothetical protein